MKLYIKNNLLKNENFIFYKMPLVKDKMLKNINIPIVETNIPKVVPIIKKKKVIKIVSTVYLTITDEFKNYMIGMFKQTTIDFYEKSLYPVLLTFFPTVLSPKKSILPLEQLITAISAKYSANTYIKHFQLYKHLLIFNKYDQSDIDIISNYITNQNLNSNNFSKHTNFEYAKLIPVRNKYLDEWEPYKKSKKFNWDDIKKDNRNKYICTLLLMFYSVDTFRLGALLTTKIIDDGINNFIDLKNNKIIFRKYKNNDSIPLILDIDPKICSFIMSNHTWLFSTKIFDGGEPMVDIVSEYLFSQVRNDLILKQDSMAGLSNKFNTLMKKEFGIKLSTVDLRFSKVTQELDNCASLEQIKESANRAMHSLGIRLSIYSKLSKIYNKKSDVYEKLLKDRIIDGNNSESLSSNESNE